MSGQRLGSIESVSDQEIRARIFCNVGQAEGSEMGSRPGQVGTYMVIPQPELDILAMVTAQYSASEANVVEGDDQRGHTIISLLAVGTICEGRFRRGVTRYPCVGEEVRSATHDDLACIFASWDKQLSQDQEEDLVQPGASGARKLSSGGTHSRSLSLGKFSADDRYDVSLDGKAFFARHAAILGSSGSGKSCTVARVIQQAMSLPDCQVILFDLHGEYLPAFCDDNGEPFDNVAYIGGDELVLPYWLLKYEEMENLFVDKSSVADVPSQQTFLKQTLMRLRGEAAESLGLDSVYTVDSPLYYSLEQLRRYANNLNSARYVLNTYRLAFRQTALRHLPPEEQEKLMFNSDVEFNLGNPEGETPHPLYHNRLGGLVNLLDQKMYDHRYNFLLRPVEQAQQSSLFRGLFRDAESPSDFSRCLEPLLALLTGHTEPRKNLVILDLSRIPFETIDIAVALLTRILYEFNFWCAASDRTPVVLVYEEAHNYISDSLGPSFAKRAVERVAKEGRKYGVGALVVSQRPLEVSETVLSQCNSFVIMRMSNPADQAYVSKVVSEQFSGLAGTLAQLRPGEAYAVGEAVPMPMRTQITLTERPPDSGDAEFFGRSHDDLEAKDIASIVRSWWRQQRPPRQFQRKSGTSGQIRIEPEPAGTTV